MPNNQFYFGAVDIHFRTCKDLLKLDGALKTGCAVEALYIS